MAWLYYVETSSIYQNSHNIVFNLKKNYYLRIHFYIFNKIIKHMIWIYLVVKTQHIVFYCSLIFEPVEQTLFLGNAEYKLKALRPFYQGEAG